MKFSFLQGSRFPACGIRSWIIDVHCRRCLAAVIIFLSYLTVLASLIPPPNTTTIGLGFFYPTNSLANDTGLTVAVHASPDQNAPLTNWPIITNLMVTNLVLTNLDTSGTNAVLLFRISAPQAQMFYFLTFSNFWGASPPSSIANTPAPVPTNITTQITR